MLPTAGSKRDGLAPKGTLQIALCPGELYIIRQISVDNERL